MKSPFICLFLFASFFIGQLSASPVPDNFSTQKKGLLLLAYGMEMVSRKSGEIIKIRNQNITLVAKDINHSIPTEVAFGLADPDPIQAAVNRLEKRGVTDVVVVPVYVSSHSAIIGNYRYIVGLQDHISKTSKRKTLGRIKSALQFKFTSAMDTDLLVSEVLLDRANSSSKNANETTLILIAHGPENRVDNDKMIQDMEVHAKYLTEKGHFKKVLYLTLRSNSPIVGASKIEELRRMVSMADSEGDAVILPLALSTKGLSSRIKNYLMGMNYAFAKSMMPHPNIESWIVEKFNKSSLRFTQNE